MGDKTALLAAINSALSLETIGQPLSTERVRMLGKELGFSESDTLELVRQLAGGGEINLEWGGAVASIARQRVSPSIHLEAYATYVGPGVHIQNSAVGSGALLNSASSPEGGQTQIAGTLTALIERLAAVSQSATAEQNEALRDLVVLTRAMQRQLLAEKPDKTSLQRTLREAKSSLDLVQGAAKLGSEVIPYLPRLLQGLHQAYEHLSSLLGAAM